MSEQLPHIWQGAEPYFSAGDGVGYLILHGFMASPTEVLWAGKALADAGRTVYIQRQPGHGINPEHMSRMRWQDWYAQAVDGYHILSQMCERVYVVGHSMGGLLALLIAAEYPVNGAVIAAAPLAVPDGLMRYGRLIASFKPYTQHPSTDAFHTMVRAEQERRGEPPSGRVHYAKWSSRAVYELYTLIGVANEHLARVDKPLLLLYATKDQTVPVTDSDIISQKVKSDHVQSCIIEDGEHLIYLDIGRQAAIDATVGFIDTLETKNGAS